MMFIWLVLQFAMTPAVQLTLHSRSSQLGVKQSIEINMSFSVVTSFCPNKKGIKMKKC